MATTKSAIVVSSVSPERWLTIAVQPARRARSIAAIVSVSVPIWLSLMRTEFAARSSIPRAMNSGFVTSRSSPTSWTRSPSRRGQLAPAGPVVLGQAVLERHDRVLVDPVGPEVDELAGVERPALALERGTGRSRRPSPVPSTRIELVAGSSAMRDLLARPVAGLLDRPQDDLDGGLVRGQRRGEAALVALADRVPAVVEDPRSAAKTSAPARRRLGERGGPDRGDHELLEVGRVDGVLAAVEDVEERDRQRRSRRPRRGSGRAAGRARPRPRGRRRARRPRIAFAPRLPLFGVPSSAMSAASIAGLVGGVLALERRRDRVDDVGDGVEDALAAEAAPCRRRGARPPRGRRSRRPTARRPGRPSRRSRTTSTSTVGLPRESRISRASMVDDEGVAHVSPLHWSPAGPGGRRCPGSSRPSRNSSDAPPPVLMWVIRSARPCCWTRRDRVAAADDDGRARLGLVGQEAGDRPGALGERRDLEHAERPVPEHGLRRLERLLHRGQALLADVDDVPRRGDLLGAASVLYSVPWVTSLATTTSIGRTIRTPFASAMARMRFASSTRSYSARLLPTRLALGDEERVRHPAADDEQVDLVHEVGRGPRSCPTPSRRR